MENYQDEDFELKDLNSNINVQVWFMKLIKAEPIGFSMLIKNELENLEAVFGEGTQHHADENLIYFEKPEQGLNYYITFNKSNKHIYYYIKAVGQDFEKNQKIGSYLTNFLQKVLKELVNKSIKVVEK